MSTQNVPLAQDHVALEVSGMARKYQLATFFAARFNQKIRHNPLEGPHTSNLIVRQKDLESNFPLAHELGKSWYTYWRIRSDPNLNHNYALPGRSVLNSVSKLDRSNNFARNIGT